MAGNGSGKGLWEESSRGVFTPPKGFLLLLSGLFLVLFGWATVPPCEPIPGCLKQADYFGCAGTALVNLTSVRVVTLATFILRGAIEHYVRRLEVSHSPKQSVCCPRTFCSCYVWS